MVLIFINRKKFLGWRVFWRPNCHSRTCIHPRGFLWWYCKKIIILHCFWVLVLGFSFSHLHFSSKEVSSPSPASILRRLWLPQLSSQGLNAWLIQKYREIEWGVGRTPTPKTTYTEAGIPWQLSYFQHGNKLPLTQLAKLLKAWRTISPWQAAPPFLCFQ